MEVKTNDVIKDIQTVAKDVVDALIQLSHRLEKYPNSNE